MASNSTTAAQPRLDSFGDRLRYCRTSAGLSQDRVAASMGVVQGTIGQYEQNKIEPTATNLAKLAGLFGVSMDWLFTGGATVPVVSVKAAPSSGRSPAETMADSMLTSLQQATVDLLRTVAKAGLLPNAECLGLMTDWQERLDKKQQL